LTTIAQTKDLSDETVGLLENAIGSFKRQFAVRGGEMLVKDEPVAALANEEVDPTTITRQVRATPAGH